MATACASAPPAPKHAQEVESLRPSQVTPFTPPPVKAPPASSLVARRIGVPDTEDSSPPPPSDGRPLGIFRNTYYDFPSARDYEGSPVALYGAQCQMLARVPRDFHDAVCVQGSGRLASGQTVSFARRGCKCARTCPRTDQKICFDALSRKRFPWGRGAMGQAIVPLRTVAVDSRVIPLGTNLFIPAFVGMPRSAGSGEPHDGCFVAADRGIKIVGKHVDIFTGEERVTRWYNQRIPSNRGLLVFAESERCKNAATPPSPQD